MNLTKVKKNCHLCGNECEVEATTGDILQLDTGALICEKCMDATEIKQNGAFIKGDFGDINSVEDLLNAMKNGEVLGISKGMCIK